MMCICGVEKLCSCGDWMMCSRGIVELSSYQVKN